MVKEWYKYIILFTIYEQLVIKSRKPEYHVYNAHHLLLTSCIAENIISNDLRPALEGTIGNHDEEFKWQVIIIKQWQTYQLKSKT